jgi:predicted ester cyclase
MNEVRVREFFSLIEQRDWARLDGLLHERFRATGPTSAALDRDGFVAMHAALGTAIKDWRFNVSAVVPDGDRVVATIRITGTHTGLLDLPMVGLRNVPPTNLAIHLPEERPSFAFRDGLISEMAFKTPTGGGLPGILNQLGVRKPAPA